MPRRNGIRLRRANGNDRPRIGVRSAAIAAIAANPGARAIAALAATSARCRRFIQRGGDRLRAAGIASYRLTVAARQAGSPGLTPSAPAAPSSPWTVISARTPPALTITKASDATPVINARVKIER